MKESFEYFINQRQNKPAEVIGCCLPFYIIMAALWNRAGCYIFVLWFLSSFFLFFPRLISSATGWMSVILLHMVWPLCKFRMQVWNMLHAARWKCRTQKSPSEHHRTTLSGYIFGTKALIDNREKLVKQQYLPNMSSQYGELWPTSGWDRFVSLGHPRKFQRVSRLGYITAATSQRKPTKLCTMVGSLLGWYTISP